MNAVLEFEHVSLTEIGPTLTVRLEAGQLMAIVGPTRSGKSEFLEAISGESEPKRGRIRRHQPIHVPAPLSPSRRVKLQSIAFSRGTPRDPEETERVTESLDALGLWPYRKMALSELTDQQLQASSILPSLIGRHEIIVIDQTLDSMDPMTMDKTLAIIRKRLKSGACAVIGTHCPEVAQWADLICVLKSKEIFFVGSPQEVIQSAGPSIVTVATDRRSAITALSEPFAVTVTEREGEVCFEAMEGQALAAKMLLEGYGDVRFTVIRRPTFRNALARLLRQNSD